MSAHARRGEESLWVVVASPAIWAAHFLLSYATAAIWCAKVAPPGGSLLPVRIAVAIYTALALAGIAAFGWRGLRHHREGGSPPPHDRDTPQDRSRFLGFSTLLLSALSAVAVLYAALVVVIVRSCR